MRKKDELTSLAPQGTDIVSRKPNEHLQLMPTLRALGCAIMRVKIAGEIMQCCDWSTVLQRTDCRLTDRTAPDQPAVDIEVGTRHVLQRIGLKHLCSCLVQTISPGVTCLHA